MKNSRVKYPNRVRYFGIKTGLLNAEEEALKVEEARLKRLSVYNEVGLVVESLEQFKEKFGL